MLSVIQRRYEDVRWRNDGPMLIMILQKFKISKTSPKTNLDFEPVLGLTWSPKISNCFSRDADEPLVFYADVLSDVFPA
jgi:hypothetical protein